MKFIDGAFPLIDFRLLFFILLLASICYIAILLRIDRPLDIIGFSPEQISYFSMPDTRIQRGFYYYFAVSLFCGSFLVGILKPSIFTPIDGKSHSISNNLPTWSKYWIGLIIWIAMFYLYDYKPHNFILALFTIYCVNNALNEKYKTTTLGCILGVTTITIFALPLLFQPMINKEHLWAMDTHWVAVIGQGLVGHGDENFSVNAFSSYGVLLNELVAVSQNALGYETLAETQQFLKLTNLIFSIFCFIIIIQRINLKNVQTLLIGLILFLLLFFDYVSGISSNFIFPNQLPIRFIMVPITLVLAFYVVNLPILVPWIFLGITSPILIFYNFETSLFCILGFGFALVLKTIKHGFLNLILATFILAVSFTASGFIFLSVIFDNTLTENFQFALKMAAHKMNSGSNGYASLSFFWFSPFMFMMLHCSTIFSRYLISIKDKKRFSAVEFQGAVIVGIIIAMGPYMLNRYSIMNMWVPFLLYFLFLTPRLLKNPKSSTNINTTWVSIIMLMVLPFTFGNPLKEITSKGLYTSTLISIGDTHRTCLDGFLAPNAMCNYAEAKAQDLENLKLRFPDIEWVSGLTLSMSRLTELSSALEEKSLFFYAHHEVPRNKVISSIRKLDANYIAIDNITSTNAARMPEVVEVFQTNLIKDAGFEIVEETIYWRLAKRIN